MKAKDIHDCQDCPLYDNECSVGWSSNGNGNPVEPPCCDWNDEDEICAELNVDDDVMLKQIERTLEIRKTKEQKEKQENREKEKERLKKLIYGKTKYGTTDWKPHNNWFCPRCNKWVHPFSERSYDGISETTCPECDDTLIICVMLGDEIHF